MRSMSLYESNESNGLISLRELFEHKIDVNGIPAKLDVNEIIFAACRGGWPSAINLKSHDAQLFVAKDYFNNICENDVIVLDSVNRNSQKVKLLMKSYAKNLSTIVKNTSILADVNATEEMSINTLTSYLDALRKLYVVDELDAWCPNIRSKSAMRSSPKREFIDPSIAVAALGYPLITYKRI